VSWTKELTELRNVLMALYDSVSDARRVAQEALLNTAHVDLSGKAINFWQSILEEANKQHLVSEVIEVARTQFPNNTGLEAAVLEWRKSAGLLLV
jgi:hypothetical protein